MIHPQDLSLIGLKAHHAEPEPESPQDEPPSMTYEIAREDGAWRILFHDCPAGRFDSFDAALAYARNLARECAALGRTACVALQRNAPPSKREVYPARAM